MVEHSHMPYLCLFLSFDLQEVRATDCGVLQADEQTVAINPADEDAPEGIAARGFALVPIPENGCPTPHKQFPASLARLLT